MVDLNEAQPIAKGGTAQIFRLSTGQVAKKYSRQGTKAAQRELTIARHVAAHGVRTWRVDGIHDGPDGAILLGSFVDGVRLRLAWRRWPLKALHMAHGFGRVHAQLHALPAEGLGYRATGLAPRQVRRALPAEFDRAACAAIRRHLLEKRPGFCHGDFHDANVICRDGEITHVLDWAAAGTGNQYADAGRTCSSLLLGLKHDNLLYRMMRYLLFRIYLRAYTEHAKVDPAAVQAWAAAFMALRLSLGKRPRDFWNRFLLRTLTGPLSR